MIYRLKPNIKLTLSNPRILRALETGEKDPELPPDELAQFYYYLELLKKRGLLAYQTPLIELHPLSQNFSIQSTIEGSYSLSRFAMSHLVDDAYVFETPLCPAQVHIRSFEALHFIYAFRTPMTLKEAGEYFPHLDIKETFILLCSAGLLTNSKESTPLAHWEFHDLYFHSRSRRGRHENPVGATYRFKGCHSSLPAIKKCPHTAFDLPKPDQDLSLSLGEVLEQRRSIRTHGSHPISVRQLGAFLYHSLHVKKLFTQGEDELTLRPYPGGGARYEQEIYLVVNKCTGLDRGVYHYHPLKHQLCTISPLDKKAELFLTGAKQATGMEDFPQIVIVIGARFQRMSWKYESIAYSLILKNAGVLIQTFYLVAIAMGLAPCGIGSGNSDLFCEVMGTDYLEESSIAEFMLGSAPQGFAP